MQMITPVRTGAGHGARDDEPPALESQDILAGKSCVRIVHEGKVYLLRATRQGKLLLTK